MQPDTDGGQQLNSTVPPVIPVAQDQPIAPIPQQVQVPGNTDFQNPNPVAPDLVVQTTTPTPIVQEEVSQVIYASVWARFAAQILDGLILAVPMGILSFVSTFLVAIMSGSSQNVVLATLISFIVWAIEMVVYVGYGIYFIGKKGQTPGKMALKIKVVSLDGINPMGFGKAALRETVGKFVSSLVFSLGYLWVLWDPQKQSWHDKIAKTIVVKV